MASTATVPPFLRKMHAIISDPANEEICSWGKDNDTLFVKDIEAFARDILPKHFKHSNYSSFTRQLHKYDFHKTIHNPRHGEFKHPYFLKDRPDMLEFIQRKIYVKKDSPESAATDIETDVSSDKASSVKDFDFDFDFQDDDYGYNLDYESAQYDEIESKVENSIIEFDSEVISHLEKRQAHLIAQNEDTRKEIEETVHQNKKLNGAIDKLLDNAVDNVARLQKGLPPEMPAPSSEVCEYVRSKLMQDADIDTDELCELMKAKCKMKSSIRTMVPKVN